MAAFSEAQRERWLVAAPNNALHWTGSSRFSLFQRERRWRLLPASELRRWAGTLDHARCWGTL